MKIFWFVCNELFSSFRKHFATYLKLIIALAITFVAGVLTLKMAIKQYEEMQQLNVNDRTYCLDMNGEITEEFLGKLAYILQGNEIGATVENIEFQIAAPEMIPLSENNYVSLSFEVLLTEDELKKVIDVNQKCTIVGLYMSNRLHESLWQDNKAGDIIEIEDLKFQICGFRDTNCIHADSLPCFGGYHYVIDEICYDRVLDINEVSILEQCVSDIMGYSNIMSRTEKYSLNDIGKVKSNLQLIVLMFVVCGINVIFIFKSIRNLENEKICIYRICGVKPSLLFSLYVSEFFMCILIGTGLGILGDYALAQLEVFKSFESNLSVLQLSILVGVFVLLEFMINLPHFISLTRKKPVESMRA